MRRRTRKSKRHYLLPVLTGLFLLFIGQIAVDQFLLFTRHHEQIEQREAQVRKLETEITELEQDLKEVDSLPFIMKYALKYGMQPTDTTPRPVGLPTIELPHSEEFHEDKR